jgi:hypothetical protein
MAAALIRSRLAVALLVLTAVDAIGSASDVAAATASRQQQHFTIAGELRPQTIAQPVGSLSFHSQLTATSASAVQAGSGFVLSAKLARGSASSCQSDLIFADGFEQGPI